MLRRTLSAALFLVVLLNAPPESAQETLSRKQLNTLTKTARTDEQYARLEKCYKEQAKQFGELEHSAKQQMELALKSSVYSKYPSEYDRSRNLWMYYTSRKQQATALEKLYEAKKASAPHENKQPTSNP